MDKHQEKIRIELHFWKKEMMEKPSLLNKFTNNIQKKINSYIPEKVHTAITVTIKKMVQAVLYGSTYTTSTVPPIEMSLIHREALVKQKIDSYCKTGAAEGGITGAGGFLMSMADFPVLIGIKMKMLFEIAALYGFDVKDYRERLYILYIFQLAFSSQHGRTKIFMHMENWNQKLHILPENSDSFDWKTFQQEYRDYIDLAKMAQLLPVVGAAVGAVANYQLIKKLGKTAMQAYRMRLIEET
ncbi:EcsC family protein [Pedobacter steynii]|uniref:ABC transporter-associated protein EcsC n=1 Tax=Pedobacter steynii TaxID=430522 RepID=A0A1D7QHM7_9SPHI|nr:EcsC family protein [Pedobacter steynii]AOM78150.1 ABC transporter-associated protein EcsC [Pedobacter steynii]